MKRKKLWIIVLAAAIVGLAALSLVRPLKRGYFGAREVSERSIHGAQITESTRRAIWGRVSRAEREYSLDNGDTVLFGRMSAGSKPSAYHAVRTDTLECSGGTVWYYDSDTADWASCDLAEMQLGTSCVYIDGDTADYYAYLPVGYTPLENNSLCENGSKGYITIEKGLGGWKLRMYGSSLAAGEVCDYTLIRSTAEENLLDTSYDKLMQLWRTYCNNGDGRWCYDGYYFPAASTYIPSGPGCLYRCVAAYFARSMATQAGSVPCAADLSLAILDTLSLQQNEEGYFPSMSGSTWLNADYGIEPGYYDTRFNSDLMVIYDKQMERDGGFEDIVNRYFDFYLRHAEENHYDTENGGILVWDYNHAASPVHSSLNHQLSEMLVLYRFAERLGRPELTELADRMLLGLEDTCDSWIMEDNNLHYARLADGSFGKDDYPYLTYNDLYDLQQQLTAMGRERSEELDRLMKAKLSWMEDNGVTGYKS